MMSHELVIDDGRNRLRISSIWSAWWSFRYRGRQKKDYIDIQEKARRALIYPLAKVKSVLAGLPANSVEVAYIGVLSKIGG